MKQRPRIYYSEADKALMWERWQKGDSFHAIARLFDRGHSSVQRILGESGGIRPLQRKRSRLALTMCEREEISRGIVAGIQTTVAAMRIIITSSIAKNLLRELKPDISNEKVKLASRLTMRGCFAIAIGLALLQPPLIQWIIFFSIGGLEAATFGPILLGMFWKKGNQWGALASIIWGMGIYAIGRSYCQIWCFSAGIKRRPGQLFSPRFHL